MYIKTKFECNNLLNKIKTTFKAIPFNSSRENLKIKQKMSDFEK